MTKQEVLAMLREQGKKEALQFRDKIIVGEILTNDLTDNLHLIPEWNVNKDYSNCPQGSVVQHNGQLYKLNKPSKFASAENALEKESYWSKI